MSNLNPLCAANRTFASPCGKSGASGQSEYFYGNALPDLELMSTFRSLVESAVVRPRQAPVRPRAKHSRPTGQLNGNRYVGFDDGRGRGTRTPDPRIMIPWL